MPVMRWTLWETETEPWSLVKTMWVQQLLCMGTSACIPLYKTWYSKCCRDSWFRLGMRHFRKNRCPAVPGYVSPATKAFLCCPSCSLSCLRLVKILQKKVKPMYNSFVMKCLIPDPSEGLFNFQRLKYNYVYFSMPNLAHCPFAIMAASNHSFERNSHAFLFLRFAYSYWNIGSIFSMK